MSRKRRQQARIEETNAATTRGGGARTNETQARARNKRTVLDRPDVPELLAATADAEGRERVDRAISAAEALASLVGTRAMHVPDMDDETGRPMEARGATHDSMTPAGQRLARVMLDPRHAHTTVRERCRAAGISVSQYYRLTASPEWQAAVRAGVIDYLGAWIGPLLDASIATALIPGREGSQDRQMLLRVLGFIEERRRHEHTGPGGGPLSFAVLPPQEVEERIRRLKLQPDAEAGGTDAE